MSILDIDFYKLTMLQFIWKNYAEVPVTFRLHSRKQQLKDVVQRAEVVNKLNEFTEHAYFVHSNNHEYNKWLRELGCFEDAFISDFYNMLHSDLALPHFEGHTISVTGPWFTVSIWETVILAAVSEAYSVEHVEPPSLFKQFSSISRIAASGAWWADFGTRRRHSRESHDHLVHRLALENNEDTHFMGTSNVDMARRYGLTPIGTYAHELEMVLRPYFDSEFDTTRDVLTKWQEMYPWRYRVALTDTYTTPRFFEDHGKFLMDNNWRGVRLDSGDPLTMGKFVDEWLAKHRNPNAQLFDVVFSDGLDAGKILRLQNAFGQSNGHPSIFINPVFGWGTGLTNPNSDLSLVMKAVASRGQDTYKITDDETKAIR